MPDPENFGRRTTTRQQFRDILFDVIKARCFEPENYFLPPYKINKFELEINKGKTFNYYDR